MTSDIFLKEEGEENEVEFLDLEESDVQDSDPLQQATLHYQIIRYRYQSVIPSDIIKLLNRTNNTIKVREPSALVTYLIFSNMASFLFYYRLWNGEMLISDDEDKGMPVIEAKNVCKALLTQLLSRESQQKIT